MWDGDDLNRRLLARSCHQYWQLVDLPSSPISLRLAPDGDHVCCHDKACEEGNKVRYLSQGMYGRLLSSSYANYTHYIYTMEVSKKFEWSYCVWLVIRCLIGCRQMLQDDKMEPNVLSLFLCFFIQACSATSSFFVELQLSLSSYFFEKLNSINRSRDHGFIVCHYCQTTFFALPVLFNMSANLGLPHAFFRSSIFLKAIVFAVLGVTFPEHWQTPAEHHTSDWVL